MKTKKIIPLILVLMLLVSAAGFSQTGGFYTISGTIRDADNKRALAYATMYVPGTYLGTVANSDGVFSFKIKDDVTAQYFVISYMGYELGTFSIKEYSGKNSDFLLKAHVVPLQEVTFRPMNPRDLVEKAIERIPANYPQEPYNLTGFYRETIKQRRDYLTVAEAVFDVYKEPYDNRGREDQVRILRGRKSGSVKKADTLLVKLQGGPQVAMLLDIVKNNDIVISEETIDFYSYELLDLVIVDDMPQYVIGFKPRVVFDFPLFEGKLYICNQTLAVTMADFGYDLSDKRKAANVFVKRKPVTLRFTPNETRYLVKYQKIGDQYFVNYMRSDLEFFVNWRRKIFRTRYNLMFEMAIMDRSNENVESFARRETFRNNNILADMVPIYFTDNFWGDYNFIEPDVSIDEAINKLNKNAEKNQDE
jgi:hypothetical protein